MAAQPKTSGLAGLAGWLYSTSQVALAATVL